MITNLPRMPLALIQRCSAVLGSLDTEEQTRRANSFAGGASLEGRGPFNLWRGSAWTLFENLVHPSA